MTSIDTFFELLRAGIWGRKASMPSAPTSWPDVIEMANRQSVVGIISDGLQELPKESLPPKAYILDLFGTTYSIEIRNKQLNLAVVQIIYYLEKHGISTRLMKGQGCALLYPKPLHRQSGDIDLFVGHKQYEQAKALIKAKGIKIEKESAYDAHFLWGNVPVELHWLETKLYYPSNNKAFQQICRKEEWKLPSVIEIEGQDIGIFNHTFNTFYVFVHLYHHFMQVGVGLRQVCDWMLLLKRNEEKIDWDCLHGYVIAIKAERAWKAFYGLAVEHLGLHLTEVPKWMRNVNSADIQFVMYDILKSGNFGKFGTSMQKRTFGKGMIGNVGSFSALVMRLFKVGKFGYQEALFYPLWRLFCDQDMFGRYKSKNDKTCTSISKDQLTS